MPTHLSLALRNEWHNELRNRHILFPAEHFLSFTTFFPLINQGIHFFGFCHYHSFLLENYKGFNTAEICSRSVGYVTARNSTRFLEVITSLLFCCSNILRALLINAESSSIP